MLLRDLGRKEFPVCLSLGSMIITHHEERGRLTWPHCFQLIAVPLSLNVQLHRQMRPVAPVLLIGSVGLSYQGGYMAILHIYFLSDMQVAQSR